MMAPGFILRRFDPRFAIDVVSWVRNADELFWLAPRTAHPLTPAKVVAWTKERGSAYMLFAGDEAGPRAYGELNASQHDRHSMWLGHLLVATDHRRTGMGRHLTQLLVNEAFQRYGAAHLALVVFPDNLPAIRCYLSCGFHLRGEEYQRLGKSRARHRLLRFELHAEEMTRPAQEPERKNRAPIG